MKIIPEKINAGIRPDKVNSRLVSTAINVRIGLNVEGGADRTWAEATEAWADATYTWEPTGQTNQPSVLIYQEKIRVKLSNETV